MHWKEGDELRQCCDADFGVRLPVAGLFEVTAFLTIMDYRDFCIATLFDEFRRYCGTRNVRRSDFGFLTVIGQEHFIKCDFALPVRSFSGGGSPTAFQLLNINNTVFRDNVLFPARLDYRDFGHIVGAL